MEGRSLAGFTLVDALVALVLISIVFFSSIFFLGSLKGEKKEAKSVAVAYELITRARTWSLSKGVVCFVKIEGNDAVLSCTDGYKESASLDVPVSENVVVTYKNGVLSKPVTVKIGRSCIYVGLASVDLRECN